MFWKKFINWVKQYRFWLVLLILISLFILVYTIYSLPNSESEPEQIPKETQLPPSIVPSLVITAPRQYQIFSPQDKLVLELAEVHLEPVDVLLIESDGFCNNNTQCIASKKSSLRRYPLGRHSFQRKYLNFPPGSWPEGQYRLELYQNSQRVGLSPEFAISANQEQLNILSPLPYATLSAEQNKFRWQSSPDVFFLNLYLESDSERFVLAENYRNNYLFDWSFKDNRGRVIPTGEYVLIFENSLSGQKLSKVRFLVDP